MRLRLVNNVSCSVLDMLVDLQRHLAGQTLLKSVVLTLEPGEAPAFSTVLGNAFVWRNGRGTHCVFGATVAQPGFYLAGEHRSFNETSQTELTENIFGMNSTSILTNSAASAITLDFYYTGDVTAISVIGGAIASAYATVAWFSKPASVLSTSLGRTHIYTGTAPGVASLSQTKSFDCLPGSSSPSLGNVPGLILPISHASGLYDGSALVKRPVPVFSTFAHDLHDLNRRAMMLWGTAGYTDRAVVNGRNYRGFSSPSWSGSLFLEAGV